jgi:hypothetical protein
MNPLRALFCAALGLAFVLLGTPAFAADLTLNGGIAGPAVCPDGGAPVDKSCEGDGFPTVAGIGFRHSIFELELGAAGGDKGRRDVFRCCRD